MELVTYQLHTTIYYSKHYLTDTMQFPAKYKALFTRHLHRIEFWSDFFEKCMGIYSKTIAFVQTLADI